MPGAPRFPLAFVPALLVLLGASSASAQRRGHRVHDGFYFRGSIGPGTVAFDQRSDWPNVPEGRVTGPGVASDLMIGGTPARGFVVGGALIATQAPDPDFDGDRLQLETNNDATWVLIGPFVDFFFAPRKGFHLGAAAGPSAIWYRDLDPDPDDERREAYAGVGAAGWAGYDAWISSNWSLGGYLRVTAAWTRREVDYASSQAVEEQANGVGFAALFSALYH
jgi:hypothetical protein